MGLHTPEARVYIDGFPIDTDTPSVILKTMGEAISQRSFGHYISITNTESMYHAHRLPSHGKFISEADFSLCDGVGVILAGFAFRKAISRYNGPILQLNASEHGVAKGWRHFFVGGTDGSAQRMAENLDRKYPGIAVVGIYEPPFRPLTAQERSALVDSINNSQADIVWVGLGLIKQEEMIANLIDDLQVPWMIGVGGAFDYHSGRVPWAPAIVRSLGLEWLFRLIVQPKLRAKRYLWSAVWLAKAVTAGLQKRK